MTDPTIKVDKLRVIYNQGKSNETRALDGINLEIFPNEYIIIHGPSGCGKSTLLYAIAGLQAPTYGDVSVESKKISKMSKKEKVKLHQTGTGMVFQAFYLIPSLDIISNVCLPRAFTGEGKRKRKTDGVKLLRRFGIAEQSNKFPSQLSGGQKQRVAIARAIMNNPHIVLADEPIGNLDSESANNVMGILKELNEVDKKTIVLVTHNDEYLHYANRVVHMKDGKIIDIEVRKEIRPSDAVKKEIYAEAEKISSELRILMKTFKDLSPQQLDIMLTPFKAKQLLSHILSELTKEQLDAAESFLKDFLFNNIDTKGLENSLDLDFNEGGASWNKQRAKSFSKRAETIIKQADTIKKDTRAAAISVSDYLADLFDIDLDAEVKLRFRSSIKLRMENKLDRFQLQKRLDSPRVLGGSGLYKSTADKVVRELEMIMLLKYSA
ncbi:putative ABC transporter ATP-binding protein/MT1014 [bacterium BMS3Abin15]|nr:putative ABC transporter ATP-binding protein/MT1014 [bacterium BMS3Abin15]